MKEEEAKTKWCPHARASALEECTMGVTTYNYNRNGNNGEAPEDCKCLASGCMAWKWENYTDNNDPRAVSGTEGYCGLAK